MFVDTLLNELIFFYQLQKLVHSENIFQDDQALEIVLV